MQSMTDPVSLSQQPAYYILRPSISSRSLPCSRAKTIPGEECHHWPRLDGHRGRNLYIHPRPSRQSLAHASIRACSLANPDTSLDTYTMRQVGQDDFEDVKVPDTPRAPSGSK